MIVSAVFGKSYSDYGQSRGNAVSAIDIGKPGRRCGSKQRDTLESSAEGRFYNYYNNYGCGADPGKLGDSLRYRYSHTIGYTSAWFFRASGEVLQKTRGEKEGYDGTDIVNAYGFAYAERYGEIEERYGDSGEQWFDIDGTPLTKDKEMEYLDRAYESAVAFQVSSARVMAGLRQVSQIPQKSLEELEGIFYRSRDKYTDLCREGSLTGMPVLFHRFSFGRSDLLALLV